MSDEAWRYVIASVGIIGLYAGTLWLFLFSPWGEWSKNRDDREE